MLRIGIVGLPGCGKTALFRALVPAKSSRAAQSGRREIHLGQAQVPDPRLDELNGIFQRKKLVHAAVEYVDVAGFSRGDSSRRGLEDQFLGEIRTCDALLQVLRSFPLPGMPEPDPLRDFRIAEQEFILSDQIILEKRLDRLRKDYQKKPLPAAAQEIELIERCLQALEREKPLRTLAMQADERMLLRAYQPLSAKPELVVINIAEEDIGKLEDVILRFRPRIEADGVEVSAVCASIEMEIAELDAESAREFRDDLGIKGSALQRLIKASYRLLGLISFFTVGADECRAWTVRRGTTAREAAGAVHTDMERGFIRAEVVNYEDFITRGNFAACRSEGVLRLEGKDYPVKDGDIIQFRFAV